MANTSIGGLVSGLDTASIITQLMQLEAKSQTLLKSRVSSETTAVSSLRSANAKLASLTARAADLAKVSAWTPTRATSTSTDVTVTAKSTAALASLTFTVDMLATNYRATYAATGAATDVVAAPATDYTVTFADGRPPVTINTGAGTLRSVSDALNASGTGLQAAMVRTGTDANGAATFRLNVAASSTGAASSFTIEETAPADPNAPTPFLGGVSAETLGQDAEITVEGQAGPLRSASNTFTDLMPGVDVTLGPKSTGSVTIAVQRDAASLSASARSLVDALNSALDDITSLTAFKSGTQAGGLLAGNSTLRSVRERLLSSITAGVDGKSLADLGIQTDRYGKVGFDAAKFSAAYDKDPAGVTARFTASTAHGDGYDGLATRLHSLGDAFSDATTGSVSSLITGRSEAIDRMNGDIAAWDVRLAQRRTNLERQYGALEVALGKLQSQSSWLASQISSLPTMSTK